jgi:hypothetical protein
MSKSAVSHACRWNAESEIVIITKMATMWQVASYYKSRVRMCAGTNRAGFQKDPVTLRDSTNEGGGFERGVTFSTL